MAIPIVTGRFPLQTGDAVEVLRIWAYGAPAAWHGGYRVVADEGRTVLLVHTGGTFEGLEVRYPATSVRKEEVR